MTFNFDHLFFKNMKVLHKNNLPVRGPVSEGPFWYDKIKYRSGTLLNQIWPVITIPIFSIKKVLKIINFDDFSLFHKEYW